MQLAVLLLLATRVAHADPTSGSPIVALAGAGVGNASIYTDSDADTLVIEVGYRFGRHLMLGVHAGAVSSSPYVYGYSDFMGTDETHYAIRTVQYGITAQIAVRDPVWIAPWLGVQDSMQREECWVHDPRYPRPAGLACTPVPGSWDYRWDRRFAMGLTVGVDLLERCGNRLSVIIAAQRSSVELPGTPLGWATPYTSYSFGVAYHFWRN